MGIRARSAHRAGGDGARVQRGPVGTTVIHQQVRPL